VKPAPTVTAGLVLSKGRQGQIGAQRVALLESIGAHGSIAAAAKAAGLSYKGAWDAVQALNNLFDRPLVTTKAGGKHGGFAEITPEGQALVTAFHSVEAELAHVFEMLERRLDDAASAPLRTLLWSLGMKTSARNALRGVVDRITDGAVNAEVVLKIAGGAEIVAVITRHSVEDLGLAPGREAIALIKSSFVILAREEGSLRTSARNQLAGTVAGVERGAVNDEVTLDIGGGKILTATVTHESTRSLAVVPGERLVALIKASHVILAVE
jgi:molybdate transport system regulatory protein